MRISRCARCVHRMLTQVRSLRGGVKLALGVRAQRCMPILSRRDVAFEMIQSPQSLLYLGSCSLVTSSSRADRAHLWQVSLSWVIFTALERYMLSTKAVDTGTVDTAAGTVRRAGSRTTVN